MSIDSELCGNSSPDGEYKHIKEVFFRISTASPAERAVLLEKLRAEEPEIAAEIESLLDQDAAATMDLVKADDGLSQDKDQLDKSQLGQDLLGERIGCYHLRRIIASGGMGVVYEAMQASPRRVVALKLLKPGLFSRSARKRFEYEALTLGRLRHPGVAHIYELGIQRIGGLDLPYIAMEYVPGATWLTAYARHHALPIRDRLSLFLQVCDAVQHGHSKGVIHRDLKPANILVDPHGTCKVIDFGVAKATDSDIAVTSLQTHMGELVGTLQYMSPEQCVGDPHDLDVRSDVYSLGMILYELLSEQVPYDLSSTPLPMATQIIMETIPPSLSSIHRSLRGDLEAITLKCLEKDRSKRYQSVREMADDIRRYLVGDPVSASLPTTASRWVKYALRRPWKTLAFATTGMAMILTIAAAVAGNAWRQEAQQRQVATLTAYGQQMVAAEAAITAGSSGIAHAILEKSSSLGWEHEYLEKRSDDSQIQLKHSGRVLDMSLSQSGNLLLTTNTIPGLKSDTFGEASLWSINLGMASTHEKPICDFGSQVRSGTLLAHGTLVALGHENGEVSLWDISIREEPRFLFSQKVFCKNIQRIVSDASGSRLAVVGIPSDAELPQTGIPTSVSARLFKFDTKKFTLIAEFTGHSDNILDIAISPDGTRIATLAPYDPVVRVWKVEPGKEGALLVATLEGHKYHLSSLAFSPNGNTLATCSIDKTVKLWDILASEREYFKQGNLSKGVVIDTLMGHTAGVRACAFSPDGTLLATVADDLALKLWSLHEETGKESNHVLGATSPLPIATLHGHSASPLRVVFDRFSRRVFTCAEDGTVRIWSTGHLECVPQLGNHSSSVFRIVFTHRSNTLLSADASGKLYLWDTKNCHKIVDWYPLKDHAQLYSLDLHPNRPVCAVSFENGTIVCVNFEDTASPKTVWQFDAPAKDGLCRAVAYSADGSMLAAGFASGALRIWRLSEQGIPEDVIDTTFSYPGSIQAIVFSPISNLLAITGSVIDSRTPQPIRSAPLFILDTLTGSRRSLTTSSPICTVLSWSPDGKTLLSGGNDGSLSFWNMRTHVLSRRIAGHAGFVCAAAFHPTEKRVATSGKDRLIKIWDTTTGVEVAILRNGISRVADLAWSPDGKTLASASMGSQGADNTVRLWESEITMETQSLRNCIHWAAHLIRTRLEEGKSHEEIQNEVERRASPPMSSARIAREVDRLEHKLGK